MAFTGTGVRTYTRPPLKAEGEVYSDRLQLAEVL